MLLISCILVYNIYDNLISIYFSSSKVMCLLTNTTSYHYFITIWKWSIGLSEICLFIYQHNFCHKSTLSLKLIAFLPFNKAYHSSHNLIVKAHMFTLLLLGQDRHISKPLIFNISYHCYLWISSKLITEKFSLTIPVNCLECLESCLFFIF